MSAVNEVSEPLPRHNAERTERISPAIILQRFRWPTAELAHCSVEFARWAVGRPAVASEDGSLAIAPGDQVNFTTLANALDHRKWASLGRLSHLALRIAGRGRVKLTILDVAATGAALVAKQQTLDLAQEPAEVRLGDPTALGGNRLALLVEAADAVRLTEAAWISTDTNATGGVVYPDDNAPGWALQRFVWPDASRADRTALYAKWPEGPARLAECNTLPLLPNERVDLITFFNAFSHRKWARLTGIRDLGLALAGRGRVRLLVRSIYVDGESPVIAATTADLEAGQIFLPLGDPAQIGGEILGVEVQALSGRACLTSASWVTREPPRREVRLAAVVTTFKREAAAEAAARRFATETIPGVPPGTLELLIVDNGQTLALPPLPGVRVIPNRNLGGAGGFTRGLIEAQDDGRFTHVLFMDDDASCEAESVWRTMALLARLGDPRGAISGAMLLADDPCVQFEKGARLNLDAREHGPWTALRSWYHLHDRHYIVRNEIGEEANYGGWWFFAFTISAVRHLPFPFFVRGDDTDFSITNDLPISTFNGIASWCENFGYKLNPPTDYLAWRSWIALSFMHTTAAAQRRSIRAALTYAVLLGMRFDYAGMEGVLDGIEAGLAGPAQFGERPAPLADIARAKQRTESQPIDAGRLRDTQPVYHRQSVLARTMALLTLGGHLLPKRLQRSHLRHAPLAWDARPTSLLRASAVAYGTGLRLELRTRDTRKFFGGLARTAWLGLIAFGQRQSVADAYARGAAEYRSRTYWDAALGLASRKYGKPR